MSNAERNFNRAFERFESTPLGMLALCGIVMASALLVLLGGKK